MSGLRPRLGVVTPVHWKAFMGGAQYQIRCLLDYLRKRNRYDIAYFASRLPHEPAMDGYELHRIGPGGSTPRFGYAMHALPLYRRLQAWQPDVIYQRIGCAYTGIAAYYARRTGARLVWHASSDADLDCDRRVAERNVIRRELDNVLLAYGIRNADRIVVQTAHQAQLLAEHYRRKPDAIIANFHPIPAEVPEPRDPIRIVWIANFKRLKQPEAFLRLAASLRDVERARFVMIGAAAAVERAWSDELLRSIAAAPNVDYLGPLSQDAVNAELAGAYVFVNTSLYEGFPNTFIQAWLREVPVVSLSVDPDGVLHREQVGIRAGTEDQLANVIRRLITDRPFRNKLAGNAGEYAREFHSLQNVQRLADVIDGALPARAASGTLAARTGERA